MIPRASLATGANLFGALWIIIAVAGGCIEGRDLAECEQSCGPRSTCDADGENCGCQPTWVDCNQDLGQAGGDGCECEGDCESCGSSAACDPGELRSCADNRRFCERFTRRCRPCPADTSDCDGLSGNECEHEGECEGQVVCTPTTLGACGSDALYCASPEKLCRPCSPGRRDCDGDGDNGCERSAPCE